MSAARGLLVACLWATTAAATGNTTREIVHLLGYLEQSGCQFNRNGTWYQGEEAARHIRTKYRFLVDRDLVETTEQFIERAGSESSLSGKPYLVRCGDAEPVPSTDWFLDKLSRMRAASKQDPETSEADLRGAPDRGGSRLR